MEVKERAAEAHVQDNTQADRPAPNNANTSGQADAFLAAGRAAVARALSQDSQQFLAHNQQKGGQ